MDPLDIEDPGYKQWRGSPGAGGRGGVGGPYPGGGGGVYGSGGAGGGSALGQGGQYLGAVGYGVKRRPMGAPTYSPLAGGFSPNVGPTQRMAGPMAMRGSGTPIGRRIIAQTPQRPTPTGGGASSPDAMDVRGFADWLREQGFDAGYFTPGGGARLGAMRDELRRKGEANRQRALLRARMLAPDDPRARVFAQLQADAASGAAEEEALGSGYSDMLGRDEAFFRGLYGRQLDHAYGWDRADQQAALQRRMADHQSGGGIGGFLGDLAGTALGGLSGSYGGSRRGGAQDVSWMNGMGW